MPKYYAKVTLVCTVNANTLEDAKQKIDNSMDFREMAIDHGIAVEDCTERVALHWDEKNFEG